ncbi:Aste57867_9367 [Aphanomyces stellatus]|uniref:Aste57867_9367 protein n=1 Tax=Aphanomyces stellatus TaxID=120398 RepID=A0A485KMU8_9STRA|nr:hypothetical protein As57867_009331 [Aphanomyces stellatus]VFT86248.1 Aste57867_9367 [Aphanomyces stellatus]
MVQSMAEGVETALSASLAAIKFKNATWVNGTFVPDYDSFLQNGGNISSVGTILAVVAEKACSLLDTNPACFTANWELMWLQFRFWLYLQTPIFAVSVLFQWLEMWRNPYVEKVRRIVSYSAHAGAGLQLIASLFSCSAWIVRAGSQRLNPATWAIESLLLIFCACSYCFRWIAATNKVYHVVQLNNLFDLLSITSHFSLVTAVAVGKLRYSWLNFAFLRSYIIYYVLADVFDRYKQNYSMQLLRILVKAVCLIFFGAAVLYSLEFLGEIPHTNSFLFHVYMCPTPAGDMIPSNNTDGYDPGLCQERMSLFTSFYFMLVTASTVGYGDITPKTVIGRCLVCFFIPAGIYLFAAETTHLISIFEDRRMGHRSYALKRNTQHVVLTGNPAAVQVHDFLREFFHPDHESTFATRFLKQASSRRQKHFAALKRHMELVLLVECANDDAEAEFQHAVMDYVDAHDAFHGKVTILSGSPLQESDLRRAKVRDAMAVFFLPNKYTKHANEEDAANVLRVLAVSTAKGDHTQLFAMLVNSENRVLLEATGIPRDHLVCSDEIKLGLMGLSCRCRGLSTLIANLIGSFDMETFHAEAAVGKPVPLWVEEYVTGAAKEIYACHLDDRFLRMTFLDAAMAIHSETQGQVLLVAVEEGHNVVCNPGHLVVLTPSTKVYMIAESMKQVDEFAAVADLLHNTKLTSLLKIRTKLIARAHRARHAVEKRIPLAVREYIGRMVDLEKAQPPPPHVLETGGHIIICSGPSADQSIARLVNFVRPLRKDHVTAPVAIVIIHPTEFKDSAWAQLSPFGDIYHYLGSPQKHSTLVRAGIYKASSVVVLDQGSEEGNLSDSEAIFNTILIDGAIKDTPFQNGRDPFSIIELKEEHFNKYLDLLRGRQAQMQPLLVQSVRTSKSSTPMLSELGDQMPPARLSSRHSRASHASRATTTQKPPFLLQKSRSTDLTAWVAEKITTTREVLSEVRKALFKNELARDSVAENGAVGGGGLAYELMERFQVDDETFFQERYVSGGLFPAYVADELLIQSFYNPSINLFMRNVLDGKSIFMLYDIPKPWRHLQLTYGDLVERMTRLRSHALPIGLLRAPSFLNGAAKPYVYTCPYAHTIVDPQDKVFVLIHHQALHRVAKKLQRRFSARKKWQEAVALAQAKGVAATSPAHKDT